jgi:hypothetical protein
MQKKFLYTIILFIFFSSCRKDFLDRYPLDQITEQSYWKTPGDLELFVNQYYTAFPGYSVGQQNAGIYTIDNNSDDMIPVSFDVNLAGKSFIPASGGGWSWNNIRSVNVFLANYHKVEAAQADYNTYVGEALFFKAWFYYELLKRFGDVPWYSKPLETNSEELYSKRTPRNIVADSIIALLDNAIGRLKPKATATAFRVNKEAALVFKSRVALFEGTWEKYHNGTPYGVSNANPGKYFDQSANAVQTLMSMAGAPVIYTSGNPTKDYISLFNRNDYSGVSEIILWKKFDRSLGMGHSAFLVTSNAHGTGLSKALIESYLSKDGLPISMSPLYNGDANYIKATENRDPRMAQTLFMPGDAVTIRDGNVLSVFSRPSLDGSNASVNSTGYQIEKGHRPNKNSDADFNDSDNASIIFRYAEALLNYAEAKAESGTITQADLDKSVNLLRSRAGMPPMLLSDINSWSNAKWDFPGLSPVINEIRRERRVELAVEGYRNDDLRRWRAHHLISGVNPLGAKFVQSDYPHLVIGRDIYVNNQGYIDPYQKSLPTGWQFNPNRDYLFPIPTNEYTLNTNLDQNPGWQ